jgi:hypothetical protein
MSMSASPGTEIKNDTPVPLETATKRFDKLIATPRTSVICKLWNG